MFPIFLDENRLDRGLIRSLQALGLDVLTSADAGLNGQSDEAQLQTAADLKRVIITADKKDFPRIHWEWVGAGKQHAGIVIAKTDYSIGEQSRRLLRVMAQFSSDEMKNRLEYLSNW
jgi:predicted nuclease of predicted toxin-antitoxin system